MSTAEVILSVAKQEFDKDQLIELYCVDPTRLDYTNEIINQYSKLKVELIEKRMQKAKKIILLEANEKRKQKMIEKYETWKGEISWWRNFIA